MERKILSTILVTVIAFLLCSCGGPDPDDMEADKVILDPPSNEQSGIQDQKDAEKAETSEAGISAGGLAGGLDFTSTPDDVINRLGKPSAVETAPGVSIYYYNNEKNNHQQNAISFIGNRLCGIKIDDDRLTAPGGIKTGDSIVKALRVYGIPEELKDLGVREDDPGEVFLQKLIDAKKGVAYINNYENTRIRLYYNHENGVINQIYLSRDMEKNESVRIEPSDFTASAEEIAGKFGYPDEIVIFAEDSFDFGYADNKTSVSFLKNASVGTNSFSYVKAWTFPLNVNVGDSMESVFKRLYIPDEIRNIGIDESMNNGRIAEILGEQHISNIFFVLEDYNVMTGVNQSGAVRNISISKFDRPKYEIAKSTDLFEVPAFDKEAVATDEDLYFSGCTFGSSRLDVLKVFGNPAKAEESYREIAGHAQDYYFENAAVFFFNIDDYADLETGRAYGYYIEDSGVVGPRGLRVGDKVEKIPEVFPGNDDIDFRTITGSTSIYVNKDNPGDETNSATVLPYEGESCSGTVYINVDWYKGLYFEYKDGIITSISCEMMLD